MSSITIRDIPDETKNALRIQAAYAGKSLEGYVRTLLNNASKQDHSPEQRSLGQACSAYFGTENGVDLPPLHSRTTHRGMAVFEE